MRKLVTTTMALLVIGCSSGEDRHRSEGPKENVNSLVLSSFGDSATFIAGAVQSVGDLVRGPFYLRGCKELGPFVDAAQDSIIILTGSLLSGVLPCDLDFDHKEPAFDTLCGNLPCMPTPDMRTSLTVVSLSCPAEYCVVEFFFFRAGTSWHGSVDLLPPLRPGRRSVMREVRFDGYVRFD